MNFITTVGNNNQNLFGLLNGKSASDDRREEVVPEGMDYMCGDYLVTAEGKLMKKTKKTRKAPKKADEDFPRQNTGGTLPTMTSTNFRSEGMSFCEEDDENAPVAPLGITDVPEPEAPRTAPIATRQAAPPVRNIPRSIRTLHHTTNYKNALIVMPPRDIWDPIQQIRTVWDPAYVRWMPHINIIWPFPPPPHHADAIDALVKNGFDSIKPFDICFKEFGVFHNKQSVLFLNPEEPGRGGGLQAVRDVGEKTFPSAASSQKFQPHLTVGKMAKHKIKQVADSIDWKKMTFTVKELYIISRPDDVTPFKVVGTVPLMGK